MLQSYKDGLAIIAIVLTVFAFYPYIRGIFENKVKPHLFTWIVWALTTFIAAVIQVVKGAASGAWSTLLAALLCFWVVGLSVRRGSKDIRKIDWFFLLASLSAIPLWIMMEDPTWSAVLVTGIEIVAAFPTLRKSWLYPEQESTSSYTINTFRYLLGAIAVEKYSIATLIYPVGMVLLSGLISVVLIMRGRTKKL